MTSLLKIEYFAKFVDLLILIWDLYFSGPMAKMPWITASRDDAVVAQTVRSTTADPSKGAGTTRPASCSNTSDTGNTGGGAMIARPPPKFVYSPWPRNRDRGVRSYKSQRKFGSGARRGP